MKFIRFLSAVLALVILGNCCSKSLIVANFLMRQDQIAKQFCMKRNIPGNKCHGACCLKKALQKEDQRESKLLFDSLIKYEVTNENIVKGINKFFLRQTGVLLYVYDSQLIFQERESVFHPPSC